MESQKAFSNADIPLRFLNKLFIVPVDFSHFATVAGYVTHVDITGWVSVVTTPIMTIPATYGINVPGRVGMSLFNRSDIEWRETPELFDTFDF